MRIDAHQHFWRFDAFRDSWITEEMEAIRDDFMPNALQPLLEGNGFEGCVAVEAHQSEEQTVFLIALAESYSFIKGVVGWVDLQAENVAQRLQYFSKYKSVKGFRHGLQSDPRRDLMLSPAFVRGISALQAFGFTYDLLILPDQLIYAKNLAAQFPEQRFVIDHLAKPLIRKKEIKEWASDMAAIAKLPNVWCKLSGMVTEADWRGWQKNDFSSYMNVILENFGVDRIMFGSDWPVCLLAASYEEVTNMVKEHFSGFSAEEQEKIFGGNAVHFYNL